MTTPGKVLFFIGLLLSIVAVAVAVWGVTTTVRTASTMQADSVQVPAGQPVTVPMQAGHVRLVLGETGTHPGCTVTSPDGTDLPITQDPAFDAAGDQGVTVVGTFTAEQDGDHTVACDAPAMVSPSLGLDDVTGIVAAGIAFLALFPLGLLTLVGLILWLVGRSRDKRSGLAASGYPGPGGYAGTGGYGGPGAPGYGGPGAPGYGGPTGYGSAEQPYGTPQDPPPPPGSGGWQSAPPPPPRPSDPYAAPQDGADDGDERR